MFIKLRLLLECLSAGITPKGLHSGVDSEVVQHVALLHEFFLTRNIATHQNRIQSFRFLVHYLLPKIYLPLVIENSS
jgi:hypothetical protein